MQTLTYFAQDAQGNVLPSADCIVYLAGTATPASGLEDAQGNPLANPFTADSGGVVQFAIPDGFYDLRVTSGSRTFMIPVEAFDGIGYKTKLASDIGASQMGWKLESSLASVIMTQALKNAQRVSVATWGVNNIGDCTAQMADAIAWQIEERDTFNPTIGGGGGSAIVNCPVLTIPDSWTVSVTTLPTFCILVSEGKSTIQGLSSSTDIVIGADTYMMYCADITFLGGKSQLVTQNNNINAGLWLYERCTFEGSADHSVKALNTSVSYGVTSTQLILNECRWIRCKRGLKTQCDHSYISGGWMQPEGDFFDGDTAFIDNTGLLSIDKLMGIPGGSFPAKSRWIDNHGSVRCSQTRFGGEGGGLPIIYHFAAPTRYLTGTAESIEMGISFDQCTLYGGAGARPDCGIIVLQGQLPPVVRITDSTGPITVPYIRNDPANGGIANLTSYLAALKAAWSGDDLYGEFGFHYRGNKTKFNTATVRWPAELDTYTYTDDGRLVKRQCKIRTAVGTIVAPTATLKKISMPTVVYDPYAMIGVTSGDSVIKAPPYARFVKFQGYCEVASPPVTNLIYNLRAFIAGVAVDDAYVNYSMTLAGQVRISIVGSGIIAPGNDVDIRFIQSSGADVNIAVGTLMAQFY